MSSAWLFVELVFTIRVGLWSVVWIELFWHREVQKRKRRVDACLFSKELKMLVLSRKAGEFTKIVIPPCDRERTILVGIDSVKGNTVRIGIVADRSINVGRSRHSDRLGDHLKPVDEDLSSIPTVGAL
jgi:sRNA-binding carbon storage regulator CsrA